MPETSRLVYKYRGLDQVTSLYLYIILNQEIKMNISYLVVWPVEYESQ